MLKNILTMNNPTLQSQIHCQVSQKTNHTNQNLSKIMSTPTFGWRKNNEVGITCMCVAGLVGVLNFITRSYFSAVLKFNNYVISYRTIHEPLSNIQHPE